MNKTMLNPRREGFALAAAVLAMLVVGAIVTGGFYAASQEGQVAKATDAGDMALYIAETGLNRVVGQTSATTLNGIALNNTLNWTAQSVANGGRTIGNWTAQVTRVAQSLYLVKAVGTVTLAGPYSGSTRTVAQLVRLRKADFDNNTAFQVYGNLTVGGSSDVNGVDTFYSSWTGCTTKHTGTAAVTANPTSSVSASGSGTITGSVSRQAMDSADFKVFGDMTYSEVVSMATINLAGGTTIGPAPDESGGTCNTANTANWGNPTNTSSACFTYFPIIHASGDLHITSSSVGQGIMIVDGDLQLTGGFTFYGVVVVLGTVRSTGTGGHINGSVFAYSGGDLGSTSTTLGNSLVQYSSCAIDRAVLGTNKLARAYPIYNRSWFDYSNATNGY